MKKTHIRNNGGVATDGGSGKSNTSGQVGSSSRGLFSLDSALSQQAFLSAVAVLVFCGSLAGDFVFDDAEAVVANADVTDGADWSDVFRHDFWGDDIRSNASHKSYRPLTVLSFRLNHAVSGQNPAPFHAVNILLHAVVCVLAYDLFAKLHATLLLRSTPDESRRFAFNAAAVFTVHPIHTECVANVVGRAELLAAVAFLLAFKAYNRAIEKRARVPIVTVVLAFVSMLCKEQGITVLGLCLCYDVLLMSVSVVEHLADVGNNNYEKKDNEFPKYVRNTISRLIVVSASCCLLLAFRLWVIGFQPPAFTKLDNPASFHPSCFFRVLNYHYFYFLNAWLMISPNQLCFDYSMGCIPVIETLADYRIIFVLLVWVTILAILSWFLFEDAGADRKRFILMSILTIVVPFLPASNIFFRVGFVLAERVLYLPSLGYCMLVAYGLERITTSTSDLTRFRSYLDETFVKRAFLFLLLVFTAKSIRRSEEWKTESSLFESGASVCPHNAKVHYNLGKILYDSGSRSDAEAKYREAIRLNPHYEQAMNNLANLLERQGNYHEAEKLLIRALQIRSNFPAAWMNLGIVQTMLKQYPSAEAAYLKAIRYRNPYSDCFYNLGNLYLAQGRQSEALSSWQNATNQDPKNSRAWINQIVMFDNLAVHVSAEALSHLPGHAKIHFTIGSCLGKLERFREGEQSFLIALRADPRNANYYGNLGVLYHRWRKFRLAEKMYEKALSIDPKLSGIKENYRLFKEDLKRS